jgi:choice-of-anchor C domain-containing protein
MRLTSALALALLCFARPAHAGLILNGGFESPTGTPPFQVLTGSQLTGWSITSGSVDIINGYWPASEGKQSIDLAGTTSNGGTIEQTFATTAGVTYVLTFDYANNTDVSSATANVSVFGASATPLLDEDLSHSGSTAGSLASMGYTAFSAAFVADSSQTTLRFISTGPDARINANNGVVLDNVDVVQAVPAPATAVLLVPAAVGLAVFGRRAGRRAR